MKKLKNYQIEAIKQLNMFTDAFLNTSKKETIVFQSPTGSGKTITMARYILNLIENSKDDLCFIWISIGKGDLQVQSYNSVKKEIGDSVECSLLENDFFGSREIINQNEIVFVNWEKIRSKDRKTDKFKNKLMREWEETNFQNILENTHIHRKIVLIIDESHSNSTTQRAMEIRDEIISPELTIEMSATPVFTAENINARVVVDPTDVINEGMIKKEIIINDKIAQIIEKEESEKTTELLVLESAYYKEEELKLRYKNAYKNDETKENITPLTLIQIPNSAYGEAKKEVIEKFLAEKGITVENGRLAIWLSDEKINENFETLNAIDSKVEYLIFKMAIDTGWDCPRAQILLKFREVNSEIFEIQTVGRILRMPEAKHYSDEILNRSFVYSNIKSIAIKKEIYNPNIIKSYSSKIKDEYVPIFDNSVKSEGFEQIEIIKEYQEAINNYINNISNNTVVENNVIEENNSLGLFNDNINNKQNIIDQENNIQEETPKKNKQLITLKSYYKKRTDYGDITSSFYKVYEREFCNYFEIKQLDDITMIDSTANKEKMIESGVNFGYRKKESILSDVHIESEKVDKGVQIDEQDFLIDIIMSDSDLQYDFERVIKNNLNGFAPVRSIPTVKTAIVNTFIKYLHIKPQNKGLILMQNIIVNNNDIFGTIISKSTQEYKPIHKYEVDQKERYELNENWHIPYDKNYNPNTCVQINSKLSIHQPLYMETKDGKVDLLEIDFIKYLDMHEDEIEYFWKNGSEHMNTNFGIAKEDGSAFQPDFLILFKDGRIGIFDTKAGKGFNENDNEEKSNVLQQYIVDENKKGKNIVGGLVIKHNEKFYYYDRGVYSRFLDEPNKWKCFDTLFE